MEVLFHSTPIIKQTIQTFPWRYYLIVPLWSNKQYKHFHRVIISLCPHDQTNNTHISMEVLSHSTPMIKQTIHTFPWKYYLIVPLWSNKHYKHFHGGIISLYPHDQTNNKNTSMEVLSHSIPMIKQTIQTFPWRYYLIVPPGSNKQYTHFHGGIIS
jgi:hypothetical protein